MRGASQKEKQDRERISLMTSKYNIHILTLLMHHGLLLQLYNDGLNQFGCTAILRKKKFRYSNISKDK